MRYAIFGDVHANLPALQAVLVDAKATACSHMACTGDIVGYFDNPRGCIDLIRRFGIPCVKGNFDEYCSANTSLQDFNPKCAESIRLTREQLTAEDKRWLCELPLVRVEAGFTLVHSSLHEPERWEYVFDKFAAARHFEWQNTRVCFFGHTHVPVAFVRDRVVRGGTFSKIEIEPGRTYFVNVGSVGQPRDGDPRPSYVVYDLDSSAIELRRVDVSGSALDDSGQA